MAHTFATGEWADSWWEHMRASDELRVAGATWAHGPMTWTIEPTPDAIFADEVTIRIDMHEGEVRELRIVGEAERRPVPFRFRAHVTAWKLLLGSNDDLVDAVVASKIRFEGDLTTVARHRSMFAAMLAQARAIATTWQDEAVAEGAAAG